MTAVQYMLCMLLLFFLLCLFSVDRRQEKTLKSHWDSLNTNNPDRTENIIDTVHPRKVWGHGEVREKNAHGLKEIFGANLYQRRLRCWLRDRQQHRDGVGGGVKEAGTVEAGKTKDRRGWVGRQTGGWKVSRWDVEDMANGWKDELVDRWTSEWVKSWGGSWVLPFLSEEFVAVRSLGQTEAACSPLSVLTPDCITPPIRG